MAVPLHVLRRRLRRAWRRRSLRIAAALLVLGLAAAIDVYMVAPLFDPRIDGLPADEQIIEPGDRLLLEGLLGPEDELSLDPRSDLQVEVIFEEAELASDQIRDLAALGAPLPPPGPSRISFGFNSAVADTGTCRTAVELKPNDAGAAPLTLELDPEPEGDRHDPFFLKLRPMGGDLRAHVYDGDTVSRAPGEKVRCGRLLEIDGHKLPGVDEARVVVPAGAAVRWVFFAGGDGGVVEPFSLRRELLARKLEITSRAGERRSSALRVESAGGSPSIRLLKLELGHHFLRVSYKGEGTARGPRAPAGTHPFAIFKRGLIVNSLAGAFLAAANLALLAWLKRTLFDGGRQ